MYRQISTTKMTVWYVKKKYAFRVNYHLVGETLPKESQRWILHFSSYLVIALFHRRCFDDYFLLVCFTLLYWPGTRKRPINSNLSFPSAVPVPIYRGLTLNLVPKSKFQTLKLVSETQFQTLNLVSETKFQTLKLVSETEIQFLKLVSKTKI